MIGYCKRDIVDNFLLSNFLWSITPLCEHILLQMQYKMCSKIRTIAQFGKLLITTYQSGYSFVRLIVKSKGCMNGRLAWHLKNYAWYSNESNKAMVVFGIFNCGCNFFKFTILLSIKTMGANARGSGSYKNMSVQFASNTNFLKTKVKKIFVSNSTQILCVES